VEGMPAHDPAALAEMVDEYKKVMTEPIKLTVLDCHINDIAFSNKVLEIIDGWIADGTIKMKPFRDASAKTVQLAQDR
jgi:uncharacterized protein (UPF0261 family)